MAWWFMAVSLLYSWIALLDDLIFLTCDPFSQFWFLAFAESFLLSRFSTTATTKHFF